MKVAALQYQYDFPSSFEAYQRKISRLVDDLARQGVDLLLFPEYAGYEISAYEKLPQYLDLFQSLSSVHEMFICAGTQIVRTEKGVFNRSYFFSPQGKFSYQDKCILTPYEVREGLLSAGDTIRLFDTPWGKMGICICYDVEFPTIVKRLVDKGAKLILVPSYTSSVHGFYRVLNSCRARALENQCYVVQSAMVGKTDIEMTYGAAAICGPIDDGFPEDGLLKLGTRDQVEAVIADLDFQKLEKVRVGGQTLNFQDAKQLAQREILFDSFDLG